MMPSAGLNRTNPPVVESAMFADLDLCHQPSVRRLGDDLVGNEQDFIGVADIVEPVDQFTPWNERAGGDKPGDHEERNDPSRLAIPRRARHIVVIDLKGRPELVVGITWVLV